MMGIVVPETYWAYKKYNKIISGISLGFYSSVMHQLRNRKVKEKHLLIMVIFYNGFYAYMVPMVTTELGLRVTSLPRFE